MAAIASPRFDPTWSRLPAGTEIPELRTPTSLTYSNGDGTFTTDIAPTGGPESVDSCQPTSTGWVYYWWNPHGGDSYHRYGPELHYCAGNASGAAYAEFDLKSIPGGSRILTAQLLCYQYEVISRPLRTRCTDSDLHPDSASDTAVYWAVRNGSVLADTQCDSVGWVTYNLSDKGLLVLEYQLQQGWVTLGISPMSGEGSSFGVRADSLQAYLHVVFIAPSEPEIQAVRAEFLTSPAIAGTSDTALLVLTNKGLHRSDPFWAFVASHGLATESSHVEAIAVGETVAVLMPMPLPSQGHESLQYSLWSDCHNDPWPANDSSSFTCWVYPRGTYVIEGFEESQFPPLGWAVVDNDTGHRCWERRADDGLQRSGDAYAFCQRENGWAFNDDWLISGPLYPRSDYGDSMGFFYRGHEHWMELELYILNGQLVEDTILRITHQDADTVYHWRTTSLDRFDGDTVYVGFRDVSKGGQTYEGLCLDDVWFGRVHVPGTCEPIVQRLRPLRDLAFCPNPAMGRQVMVQYDIAAGTSHTLTLHDVLGEEVASFILDPSGRTHLDLRGLPPGVYVAALEGGIPHQRRKLVITSH